jgi:uncharacterized membrane protein YfcA
MITELMAALDSVPVLWAIPVLVVAYVIRGITGFGSGLISVPLLALQLPLTTVVPLILLTDFTASLALGGLHFKKVAWDEIRRLLVAGAIGVLIGAQLLVNLPRESLLIALGTVIIAFALRNLLARQTQLPPVSQHWTWPTGLVGGTISALFGTGGPPYVMYLTRRIFDKGVMRATLSGLFFFEALVRVGVFTATGVLTLETLWLFALAVPVTLLALWVGSRIHTNLPNEALLRLVSLILLGSGVALWVRALANG